MIRLHDPFLKYVKSEGWRSYGYVYDEESKPNPSNLKVDVRIGTLWRKIPTKPRQRTKNFREAEKLSVKSKIWKPKISSFVIKKP